MEILKNPIFLSVILLFLTLYLCYNYFTKISLSKKGLLYVDLIWQSTLVIGVFFSSVAIIERQEEVKIIEQKRELRNTFDKLIFNLRFHMMETDPKTQTLFNDLEEEKLLYLNSKFKDFFDIVKDNKVEIIEETNHKVYNELVSNFNKFKDYKFEFMASKTYQNVIIDIFNSIKTDYESLTNAKQSTPKYYKKIKWFLFVIYPLILSITLGLRLGKLIYQIRSNPV